MSQQTFESFEAFWEANRIAHEWHIEEAGPARMAWEACAEHVKRLEERIKQASEEFRQALATRDREIARLYEEQHKAEERIERVRALAPKWCETGRTMAGGSILLMCAAELEVALSEE